MRSIALAAIPIVLLIACAETRTFWRNDRPDHVTQEEAAEACEIEWLMAPSNRLERQHFRGIMIECLASYGWHAEVWEVPTDAVEGSP